LFYSIKGDTQAIIKSFRNTFSHIIDASRLDCIARRTGFKLRSGKINPSLFLDLLFYGIGTELKSLANITQAAFTDHDLQVSKQALDLRFSEASTAFVKEVIREAIVSQASISIDSSDWQLFNTVRVKDSTTIELHDSLADVFKGFGNGGGPNSKAAVCIQYEFDVKSNRVFDIDLQPAIYRDANDAKTKVDDVQQGDLIIRDLGYYSDEVIAGYAQRGAYFISKLSHGVSVRTHLDASEKIDFGALFQALKGAGQTHVDLKVFIGKKRRPARLIAVLMPENVYQKRIRQRNKDNRSIGCTISEEYKGRAHFNLFVTNIPSDDCPYGTVCNLYRIRWQIELVFKAWKSVMRIDQLRKLKRERMLTTLYGKLLWILLNWKIISECRNDCFRTDRKLLSTLKCFKTLKERGYYIRMGLFRLKDRLDGMLAALIRLLVKNHWIEKRKDRCNQIEIFDLLFCKPARYCYLEGEIK
jgi:hypothetical protein